MTRALVARGHDVTVVHDEDAYLSLGGAVPTAVPDDGVHAIGLRSRYGVLSNLLTQQTGRNIMHCRRIRDIVSEDRYDIIWHNNISLVGGRGYNRQVRV